jgi:hypothetical protein
MSNGRRIKLSPHHQKEFRERIKFWNKWKKCYN